MALNRLNDYLFKWTFLKDATAEAAKAKSEAEKAKSDAEKTKSEAEKYKLLYEQLLANNKVS